MSIFHIGTLHAVPECKEVLTESFKLIAKSPGYINHNCYQDLENENKFLIIEEWESEESHKNFLNSMPDDYMKHWLSFLSKKPESSFYKKL